MTHTRSCSGQERQDAVMQLLGGKATVDQIASRLGVLPATVDGWREGALAGMGEALRRGNAKSAGEQCITAWSPPIRWPACGSA